jgi:PAS domain S-box-containing protein
MIMCASANIARRAERSEANRGLGGLGMAFPRIRLPAMSAGAPPEPALPAPDLLEPADRRSFERLLMLLRLLFVGVALLPLLAFGPPAAPYALSIAAAALVSCGLTWGLAHYRPALLLRYQLGLRLVDCALVCLVLVNYHGFLGDAYYDAAYLLFVVAAAATHGRRGALTIALAAGAAVLAGRLYLVASGLVPFAPRHLTDSLFYLLFFLAIALAVAFLMRRSSEVVERRERVWRAVLQQMPAGVAVCDAASGRLLLGNEQMEQLTGHPVAPAGRGIQPTRYGLYHPDGTPYQPDDLPLARAIRGGEVVQAEEMQIVRPEGERATVHVSAAPIRDRMGDIVAGVVTLHDVTWRKRAEEAQRFLAEASQRLADSLDYEATLARLTELAVPALADLCIVDLLEADGGIRRGAVAHANPAKQALARVLQERFAPAPGAELGVPAALRTGAAQLTPEVTAARLATFARDAEHLDTLRSLGPRSSMNVPLLARGRTLGALTFAITESDRRYDAADLALAEELACRAALALDNARLYQEAQEAVRVRDEFLSTASHDLRSPLVSVKGYAQILGAMVAHDPSPIGQKVTTGLTKIDAAATKMARLIEELIDVAYLQAGRPLALERRPTDLVALARQVASEHQTLTTKHRLVVEASTAALVGVCDPARLERVLANLLSNSLKYSPRGGTIAIGVARDEDAAGRWATLTVCDEGIGIPVADLPRVFERFHRGRNVAGYIRGSGIGLAGARQIVQQHGGDVTVTSREGAGATFTVRLPLLPSGEPSAALPDIAPPPNTADAAPDRAGAGRDAVTLTGERR